MAGPASRRPRPATPDPAQPHGGSIAPQGQSPGGPVRPTGAASWPAHDRPTGAVTRAVHDRPGPAPQAGHDRAPGAVTRAVHNRAPGSVPSPGSGGRTGPPPRASHRALTVGPAEWHHSGPVMLDGQDHDYRRPQAHRHGGYDVPPGIPSPRVPAVVRRSRGAHAKRPAKAEAQRPLWRELPLLFVVAGLLALLARSFLFQAYRIPSGSMENTLNIGDRVLVNKIVYDFRGIGRGDVVVFDGTGSWDPRGPAPSPDPLLRAYHDVLRELGIESGGTDYIKRVIGLPGDHVVCCNSSGQVTVNGAPLSEHSYVYPGNPPSVMRFNVTVPPGHLWVMGDHRGDSEDSRYHPSAPGGGSVPESEVVGRAFAVIWPPSRVQSLSTPQTFTQRALGAAERAADGATPAVPLVTGAAGVLPVAWLRLGRRRPRRRRASGTGPVRGGTSRRGRDGAGAREDGPGAGGKDGAGRGGRGRCAGGPAGRASGTDAPHAGIGGIAPTVVLAGAGMDIEAAIGNGTADETSYGVVDAAV